MITTIKRGVVTYNIDIDTITKFNKWCDKRHKKRSRVVEEIMREMLSKGGKK